MKQVINYVKSYDLCSKEQEIVPRFPITTALGILFDKVHRSLIGILFIFYAQDKKHGSAMEGGSVQYAGRTSNVYFVNTDFDFVTC